MIYKKIGGDRVSALGLGNMRLPVVSERGPIDYKAAGDIVRYAYEHGVNYFDTAYRYHQGESEAFIGKIMKDYPRDSWYLTSKIPGHMMSYSDGKITGIGYLTGFEIGSVESIFEEQINKCGTDYFDIYMLHNLSENSFDFYTNEELGLVDYLDRQKKAGRIRRLGFSSHGRADTIGRFLDWAEGRYQFEAAQIQLNYLDWTLQDAAAKYDLLTRRDMPVIAMEPVRGGKLASLGESADAVLKSARPGDSVASWAFRWLQALPNLSVALSGMSTLEQVKENVELFSARYEPMSESDKGILKEAVSKVADVIPCTGCRYCADDCPKRLDIPRLISMYNEASFGARGMFKDAGDKLSRAEQPSECVSCGVCKKLCPQGIDVPDIMAKFAAAIKNAR